MTIRSHLATTVAALLVVAAFVAEGCAADAIDALPECKKPSTSAPTAPLQRTKLRDSFSLGMPECSELHDPEVRYVHGGQRWQCGTATVEVVWGMWAEMHEPLVSVWSSRAEDAALVEAIAFSGRVAPH